MELKIEIFDTIIGVDVSKYEIECFVDGHWKSTRYNRLNSRSDLKAEIEKNKGHYRKFWI